MQLVFEASEVVATGTNPVAVHLPNNDIYIFYLRDNMVYYKQSNTGNGDWTNLTWSAETYACDAPGAFNMSNKYWSGTFTWFTWTTGEDQQVAMFPIPIFKMNPVFFRGFMAGLVSAQQLKGSAPMIPPDAIPGVNEKDPDYYNGFALGMIAVKQA